jgi:AcrR family transcriptional regulator
VFGDRGYHAASIDEIARRSGVSVPVIYDHFASKRELFEHLLAHHFAELRALWAEHATSPDVGDWFPTAVDAWFDYVERHPFAGRLLFSDTTGDPAIAATHRAIQEDSRAQLLPLTARALGATRAADRYDTELTWEALRGAMQGLAIWWYDHPKMPRSALVAATLRTVWTGLERSGASATG